MGEVASRCPKCAGPLYYHCVNKACTWMICKACNHFGYATGRWMPRLLGIPDSHG